MTSLGQILAVNPNVEIFASIKLQGVNTFPAWVQSTEDGSIFGTTVEKPLPVEYGRLLADFVSYMAGKGYTIHYLGPGNETGQVPHTRPVRSGRCQSQERDRHPRHRCTR